MSYTDDVERPFSGLRTQRIRRAAMRTGRFNGFDWRAWGLLLKRYPSRPIPLRALKFKLRRRIDRTGQK